MPGGIVKKIAIKELAEFTGLSTATVGRIVHNRSGVSEKARRRIENAVRELGYGSWNSTHLAPQRQRLKFLFLLPIVHSPFMEQLCSSILAAPQVIDDFHVIPEIRHVDINDGRHLCEALNTMEPKDYQGVGVFAVDLPGVRQAIDKAVMRGINLVTMISDIPMSLRRFFVGIDNIAAGRLAGTLMGRFLPGKKGKVGVIAVNTLQRNQIERINGFRQVIELYYKDLEILPIREGMNSRDRFAAITRQFIDSYRDLLGIYSLAADNSVILRVLKEYDIRDELVVIVHELSDEVRAAMESETIDAVIVQDTDNIARSAVRILRALYCKSPIIEDQEKMAVEFYIADNLP
jgi:LacI family transcriptional regulator